MLQISGCAGATKACHQSAHCRRRGWKHHCNFTNAPANEAQIEVPSSHQSSFGANEPQVLRKVGLRGHQTKPQRQRQHCPSAAVGFLPGQGTHGHGSAAQQTHTCTYMVVSSRQTLFRPIKNHANPGGNGPQRSEDWGRKGHPGQHQKQHQRSQQQQRHCHSEFFAHLNPAASLSAHAVMQASAHG